MDGLHLSLARLFSLGLSARIQSSIRIIMRFIFVCGFGYISKLIVKLKPLLRMQWQCASAAAAAAACMHRIPCNWVRDEREAGRRCKQTKDVIKYVGKQFPFCR